jgi:arginine deiminase
MGVMSAGDCSYNRLIAAFPSLPEPAFEDPEMQAFERVRELKIRTIDVHPDDHPFTVNCLALRPGRVVMSEASGHTLDRLARAGIDVLCIDVLSLPFDGVYRGGGGIHCSTAPLARDPV